MRTHCRFNLDFLDSRRDRASLMWPSATYFPSYSCLSQPLLVVSPYFPVFMSAFPTLLLLPEESEFSKEREFGGNPWNSCNMFLRYPLRARHCAR